MKRCVLFGLVFALLVVPGVGLTGVPPQPPGTFLLGTLPTSPIDLTETGPAGSCTALFSFSSCGNIEIFQPVVGGSFVPQRGALIIGEGVLPTLTDPSTWSDVVVFTLLTGGAQIQLFSDIEGGFPPSGLVSTIQEDCGNFNFTCAFIIETNPPTVYQATGSDFTGHTNTVTYRIFSDVEVPEPTSLLLLGSGLAGLAGIARRRHRRG